MCVNEEKKKRKLMGGRKKTAIPNSRFNIAVAKTGEKEQTS